jgi:hypothetical protein
MKNKIFKKMFVCIAMVCCAGVVFVRCANEAPEVKSVEQSNRVELESFFAKLQAKDFSVLNELAPATLSREEIKAKAEEAILKLAENPPIVDKEAMLRGHKYLEEYIEIGDDGRFEVSDVVDYQKIISDATLTVEERKAEIATLYIMEFPKQVSANTSTPKVKKTGYSLKISPKAVNCSCDEYIANVDEDLGGGVLLGGGIVRDAFRGVAEIVYDENPETIDEDITAIRVSIFIYNLPKGVIQNVVQVFYDSSQGLLFANLEECL